jgi:hypothetical protein
LGAIALGGQKVKTEIPVEWFGQDASIRANIAHLFFSRERRNVHYGLLRGSFALAVEFQIEPINRE